MAKKKTQVVETKEISKTKNELVLGAIAWMNWEKVHKIMEFLEWEWNDNGVPDTDELKEVASDLLNDVYDAAITAIKEGDYCSQTIITTSTGGLEASAAIVNGEIWGLEIKFVPVSWEAEVSE